MRLRFQVVFEVGCGHDPESLQRAMRGTVVLLNWTVLVLRQWCQVTSFHTLLLFSLPVCNGCALLVKRTESEILWIN